MPVPGLALVQTLRRLQLPTGAHWPFALFLADKTFATCDQGAYGLDVARKPLVGVRVCVWGGGNGGRGAGLVEVGVPGQWTSMGVVGCGLLLLLLLLWRRVCEGAAQDRLCLPRGA